MKKFDRSTRRHYSQILNKKIFKAIDSRKKNYSEEFYTYMVIYYRKFKVTSFRYKRCCKCEYCIENWTFSKRKEDSRCEEDYKDYFCS